VLQGEVDLKLWGSFVAADRAGLPTNPAHGDALDRLTPFGFRGGLIVILAFCLLSFLMWGYFVIYWRNADMDFMVVYNAFLLNDGAKRTFFDHPGYLTILSVEAWFRLLHQLHLLDAWTLSAIPPGSNEAAFDLAMTSAVRAARTVAGLTTGALVLTFAWLARHIVMDRRVAICGIFVFALSGGVQMHLRILRTEMIAGCFCIFALMILIIAGRRGSLLRPLMLAAAAGLCVLGLENKVHVILLILAIPALVLPFGTSESASISFWNGGVRAWSASAAAVAIACLAFAAALPLISAGLDPTAAAAAGLKPLLLGRFGSYQIVLLGWIGVCMLAFAAIWRVSLAESVAAIAAVVAGASLGLLALKIQYDVSDAIVVLNPLEKMMTFVDEPKASEGLMAALTLLLSGILQVLRRYTFVLFSSPRPAVFLTWLIFFGIFHAWRRGEKQAALQAALLMAAAIGIDALGIRRGLKIEYFVLTDPLIIIAGMVLLDRMKDVALHRWAYPIGAALVVLHIGISQAEPIKMVLKRKGPENICEWNQFHIPRLSLPWCGGSAPR
jgi:hypothetical protein